MSLLRQLGRAYVVNRMLRGGRARSGARYGRPYSRSPWAYGRRPRSRGGFFPLPHYSTRTRRGSRVTVTGCCLPIPLGMLATSVAAGRLLVRRRR
jgi:hypothetical protein